MMNTAFFPGWIGILIYCSNFSLSYIAKNYFGKSKQWLNNKINGCIVNGKPSKFTEDEKKRLNHALNDLSKKLGSIRISQCAF